MLSAVRLLQLDALSRRRRSGSRLWTLASTMVGSLLVGGIWAYVLYLGQQSSASGAVWGWWFFAAVALSASVVMTGPWRIFWRDDAALLARLPVPGLALYQLGTWRTAQAALRVVILLSVAATPWIATGKFDGWLRAVATLLCGAVCASGLGPALTAAAGAVIVSDKAQQLVTGTGAKAPPVGWLSMFPAFGGLAVGGFVYLQAPWIAEGRVTPVSGPLTLASAVVLGGVAYALGLWLAGKTMSEATREVAALDRVRLAHVDQVGARGLEALWGRAVAGAAALALYRKDVAMMRRRFPAHYILVGILIAALWLVAAAPVGTLRIKWVVALCAALAALTVTLARRLCRAPVERPRLLATLPIAPATRVRAKHAYVMWRALVTFTLGTTPAIARSDAPAHTLALVAGIFFVTLATSWLIVARA